MTDEQPARDPHANPVIRELVTEGGLSVDATPDDDPTMEHPLVAAVRAVASLSEQRDLLAYLLYVAVYEMHPTAERRGLVDAPPCEDDCPYPCGFNFRHPTDNDTTDAMVAIIAEQFRKATELQHDFVTRGADLLARWRAAREQ